MAGLSPERKLFWIRYTAEAFSALSHKQDSFLGSLAYIPLMLQVAEETKKALQDQVESCKLQKDNLMNSLIAAKAKVARLHLEMRDMSQCKPSYICAFSKCERLA